MRTISEKLAADLITHIPKVIEHLDKDMVRKKLRLNNSVRILDNCVRKLSQTKTPKRNETKQNNT